jgi:hypothetical protein
VTGSYRLYKYCLPSRLDASPEVGGVAPVKYSVGLRPPSVFDTPLRFAHGHMVAGLQARCLRVTCRFTFLLGENMNKYIVLIVFIMCGCGSRGPVFKSGTDLAEFMFSIETRLDNKTISDKEMEREIPDTKVYYVSDGVTVIGKDIKRTIREDKNPTRSSSKVKVICSFRTETEIYRYHKLAE